MAENNTEHKITWHYGGTEVHVNDIYAGYINEMPSGAWYGRVYFDDGHNKMVSFDITYDKKYMQQHVEGFINQNFDNVYQTALEVHERNKKTS